MRRACLKALGCEAYARARARLLKKQREARRFICEAHNTLAQCEDLKKCIMLGQHDAQRVCVIEAL